MRFLQFLIIILLIGCSFNNERSVKDHSMYWHKNSAEYKALCLQAYNIAKKKLELELSKDYKKLLINIFNVGSIGLGIYSPVAASDYNVGTNHTLGTLGSARFASGLNLNDFYKKISRFTLSKKGIEVIGKQAITLAEYENLYAHALSIKSRL